MSKQTMVMVLSEHAEIYWNHETGKSCCDGCDVVLCDLTEDMGAQRWRHFEHQADVMLDAGLGLTRPAEAEAWADGFWKGYEYHADLATTDGRFPDKPENPYID
jgi:hypothetical protein